MPVVSILRGVTPDEVVEIGEALYQAGARIVEVPLNSPRPFESIARLVEALGDRMIVGGGTVLSPMDAERLAEIGAELMVAPNVDPVVIRRAIELGLIPVPGFQTATEALAACSAGARYLKAFPAVAVAPSLGTVKAVFPSDISVWAVGDVGPTNARKMLNAGFNAVGTGGQIYSAGSTPEQVGRRMQALVKVVTGGR